MEALPGTPTSDRTCAATAWVRQFGSTGSDTPSALVTDADGSIYVVGEVDRNRVLPGETSAGEEDAFIRKYDVLGNALWTHQFGSTARDRAVGVTISGGVIVVAGFTGGALPDQSSSGATDAFVRAYTTDGTELWTRQLGSAGNDGLSGIAPLPSGGVAVTGYTNGTLHGEPAARAFDAFVSTIDDAGSVMWTRVFGSVSDDRGLGVAVGADGRVVVVGSAAAALPGEVALGAGDAFLRAFDAAGTALWTRQFGTSSIDSAVGVAIDARGWALVGGYTRGGVFPGEARVGGVDSFVCAFDPAGTEMWLHQYGTIFDDYTYATGIDASGNLLVAGTTAGTFPGEVYAGMGDTFVGAFEGTGAELWIRELGTTGYDVPGAVAAGVGGSVVVAGYTDGAFPGQTNAGSSDVFVTLIAP